MKCRHPVVDMAEIKARAEKLADYKRGPCLSCMLQTLRMHDPVIEPGIPDAFAAIDDIMAKKMARAQRELFLSKASLEEWLATCEKVYEERRAAIRHRNDLILGRHEQGPRRGADQI